jgi:uncharacterized protein (DUF433 family)
MVDYKKIIKINSKVRFGKPCIRNTRISVFDVLSWLASGMSNKDIIEDFPELNEQDIYACLSYAANRENRIRLAL